ncbi:MAG: hypothetical protein IRZ04_20830 [Rhodospirillales bacterium]|nr:hypothetical protein [Rhodospirillales bacterium]
MPDLATEKRLVFRILECWRELRADRAMPTPEEMTLEMLGRDRKSCFALSLSPPGDVPRFTFIGPDFVEDGQDLVGQPRSACSIETVLGAATSCLDEVLARRIPVCIGGLARHTRRPVLFRSILLPLSSDGQRIDALIGAANFRTIEGSVGLGDR